MEFSSHVKIDYLKSVTDKLLCKVVNVPTESGGYEGFQLFTRCKVDMDEFGDWYVEIDAHDNALPLMFQFQQEYFTYQLWNALRLKSSNQLRMYEILKQYENIGSRTISIKNLKELLGINTNEYPRYGDFKTHVLDVCQKALEEYTDIKFTYEPTGKKGKSGKILNLKFNIYKNENYIDQLTLTEFINQHKIPEDIAEYTAEDIEETFEDEAISQETENYFVNKIYPLLSEACENEFSQEQIQVLYNLILKIVPRQPDQDFMRDAYDYLKRKYDELKWRASITDIKSRMSYLKKIIEINIEA